MKILKIIIFFLIILIYNYSVAKDSLRDKILNEDIHINGVDTSIKNILTKNNKITNLKIIEKSINEVQIDFSILGKNIENLKPLYYNAITINCSLLFFQMTIGDEIINSSCKGIINIIQPSGDDTSLCSCASLLQEIQKDGKFNLSNITVENY